MIFRIFILAFFAFVSVVSSSSTFFSKLNRLDNGFSVVNVSLEEDLFELSQLIYHSSNKWKKISYLGKHKKIQDNLHLNPNKCRTYLKSSINEKWVLDRVFDCEHLNFILKFDKNKSWLLNTNINSLNQQLSQVQRKVKKKAIVFIMEKEDLKLFWGNQLHKLRAKRGILLDKNKKFDTGEILGESFFVMENARKLKIGSLFYVKGFSKTKAIP